MSKRLEAGFWIIGAFALPFLIFVAVATAQWAKHYDPSRRTIYLLITAGKPGEELYIPISVRHFELRDGNIIEQKRMGTPKRPDPACEAKDIDNWHCAVVHKNGSSYNYGLTNGQFFGYSISPDAPDKRQPTPLIAVNRIQYNIARCNYRTRNHEQIDFYEYAKCANYFLYEEW